MTQPVVGSSRPGSYNIVQADPPLPRDAPLEADARHLSPCRCGNDLFFETWICVRSVEVADYSYMCTYCLRSYVVQRQIKEG